MKREPTILVVDDEENFRNALKKILLKDNYLVTTAESGKKALEIFKIRAFDIIITDLRMPGMNGIELLKKVKEMFPDIGVVIFTAYGEVDAYLEAMNLGAFEYLNKPVKVEELKKVIVKVLYSKTTKDQAYYDNLMNQYRK